MAGDSASDPFNTWYVDTIQMNNYRFMVDYVQASVFFPKIQYFK